MRRNLRRSRRSRNRATNPCLFVWADMNWQGNQERSLAVPHVQRRACCTTSTARLLASLAGFPIDGGV
jgi:hypothetical protein